MIGRLTSILELLDAAVRRDPGGIALSCGASKVTFEELDGKTNQLARYLASRGLGPGTAAALMVERGLGAVLSILAVLKTGARYLALDPGYPSTHRARVLADSNAAARIAVTIDDAFLMTALAESAGRDRSGLRWSIEAGIETGSPAYTIYTSGSTGKPKGVTISHGNVCHYVASMAEALGIKESDRYLHTASFSFSSSVRQLFLPLSVGATIEIASRDTIGDPRRLLGLIRDQGVTVADLVPSYWRTLTDVAGGLEAGRRRELLDNRLRLILSASERLAGDLPRRWREELGQPARIFNMYGQTETTGIVSIYPIGGDENCFEPVIPVGSAIPGVSLQLVDGEIVVQGPTVGLGYENLPELTAARFGVDADSGERFYRTGDQGRFRDDGVLEHGGRIDQQVKIRGFRVEPGQVEAVLRRHPAVRNLALASAENLRGEAELTAFVVGPVDGLREFAQTELPDYMVPARFRQVEGIPLTPSGKVDSRRLAELAAGLVGLPEESPASTPLIRIWREVLGVERVDSASNLFDLGGHSLSAMRIVARVEEEFGVRVQLAEIFRSPTLAAMAARIDELAARHPLVSLAAALGEGAKDQPSAAERAFWLTEQRLPGSAVYSVPVVVELTGELDYPLLGKAIAGTVARQPALRTVFPALGGEPVRRVLSIAEFGFRLAVTDTDEAGMEIRKNELLRLGFDLERGPLFRAEILRAARRALLVMTLHHVVADDWSVGVLLREIGTLYEGGSLPALDEPAARAEPSGEALEYGLAYWKRRLAPPLPVLELPCDRRRPAEVSGRGAKLFFGFGTEVTGKLRSAARQAGATLFMILLAGYQALLSRYCGQTDLIVGSPVANRPGSRREEQIGAFVNTVALRGDLSGDPEFGELVERTRRGALEAFDFQDVPFARIVDEFGEVLGVERDWSRHPVFQTMFVLQNAPRGFTRLGAAAARVLEVDNGTSKFDLSLTFVEEGEGLRGEFEYSTDLFEHETIERMHGHLETLVAAAADNPRLRLSELPLLTMAELGQLDDWRGATAEYPRTLCLHQLFEAQVERTPDAEAVVFEQSVLTYADLNRRANQLARYLAQRGVRRGQLVAISMDRSLNLVVAVLGVLKAGGAYVPVDPSYPAERHRTVLEDSGAAMEVTAETLSQIDTMEESNPGFDCGPEDLAYVIYTSGSTGKPKGVMVAHQSVVNHAWWFRSHYRVTAADRVLQFASLSFDAAAEEIFPFLFSGAAVVLRTDEALASAQGLADLVGQGITVLDLPTAFWQDWTAELARAGIGLASSLRLLVVGGEKVSRESVELWRTIAAHVWFSNTYGPTEAAITASYFDFGPMGEAASVPIGRPVANASMYVLDGTGNRVPIGIPGELYIGGDGLALGYLGQPHLTRERFIANPFSAVPEARLYKTGDLVRYLPDGNLEFLGRTDHQVKLRGFRIELGEIEALLDKHPAVSQSVVVARGEGSDKSIVAYVARRGEFACDRQELKDYLQRRLPGYMVPAAIVILDRLPLNTNGKVDRRALPDPATDDRAEQIRTPVAPRNRTEREVVAIWSKVLKRDDIGIHDSFFDMGGQSLKATQVMARIRDRFGKLLPLGALFHAPTVAELAAILDRQDWELPVSSVKAVRSGGTGRALFSVHPDPVHAFRFNGLASHLGPGQSLYGIQPVSLEGGRIRTIEEISRGCIEEMKMVQPSGPYALAGYCFGGYVAYEMAVQLRNAGEDVDLLALIDSACPLYSRRIGAIDRAVLPIRRMGYHLKLLKSKGPESVSRYLEDRFRNFRMKAWRSVWNLAFALQAAESETLPLFLQDATEAFIHAGEGYHPGRYAGPVTIFRAAIRAPDSCHDPSLGWAEFVDSVETVDVPGGHDYLLAEPAVRTIADRLRTVLAGQESPVYAEF